MAFIFLPSESSTITFIFISLLINNFDLYQNREQVSHLYFYGAGCGVESPQLRIRKVFNEIFKKADISIKEDTYAAVYAASKPGEKSISISGVLPVGGVIEGQDRTLNEETGVIGVRGEVSYLKGNVDSESGPYLGFGFHRDYPGFILGYDYRKYLKSRKQKLGGQFEINLTEFGPLFHLRPSFSSVTSDSWPIYAGIHGILAQGRLKTWTDEFEFDYLDSNGDTRTHRIDEKIDYNFTSFGAGVTFGFEINTVHNSFQIQTDISLVTNSWLSDYDHGINPESIISNDWYREEDIYEGFSHSDEPALLVSASAGMSFFKPVKNTHYYCVNSH